MKNRKNKEEGKMGRPRAFAAAKSTFAAVKALFTEAKIFEFCSESLVFVHRLFRNHNK